MSHDVAGWKLTGIFSAAAVAGNDYCAKRILKHLVRDFGVIHQPASVRSSARYKVFPDLEVEQQNAMSSEVCAVFELSSCGS